MDAKKDAYERPVATAGDEGPVEAELVPPPGRPTDRDVYNVVTDTVIGPNVRWKDNVYQAVAIVVCAVVGALVAWLIWRGPGEACAGAFVGLLVGLFGSGIFLMVYRGVRHALGKHD